MLSEVSLTSDTDENLSYKEGKVDERGESHQATWMRTCHIREARLMREVSFIRRGGRK